MDRIYFVCKTDNCKYKNWIVFYGHKQIPDIPTCAECNIEYEKLKDVDLYTVKI